jgi:hypothetical protein
MRVGAGVLWLAIALAVATMLTAAVVAGPAGATMPPKRCGSMKVHHHKFGISAHLIGCDRARKASRKFLAQGKHGSSWNCTRYSPGESRIAFTCRKGRKDYYAVRK